MKQDTITSGYRALKYIFVTHRVSIHVYIKNIYKTQKINRNKTKIQQNLLKHSVYLTKIKKTQIVTTYKMPEVISKRQTITRTVITCTTITRTETKETKQGNLS